MTGTSAAGPTGERRRPWPTRDGDLTFRDPVETDIGALLAFRNLPEVNRYMVKTFHDPDDFRRVWRAIPTSLTDYSCVVERAGCVVGIGFLEIVDGAGQPGAPRGTEALIGYIIDPCAAGAGVGRATGRAVVRAAFEHLGVRRVVAWAHADNTPSVRILEAAGLRRESYSRKALWHAELGWVDEVGYALLREEWQAGPAAASARPTAGGAATTRDGTDLKKR